MTTVGMGIGRSSMFRNLLGVDAAAYPEFEEHIRLCAERNVNELKNCDVDRAASVFEMESGQRDWHEAFRCERPSPKR